MPPHRRRAATAAAPRRPRPIGQIRRGRRASRVQPAAPIANLEPCRHDRRRHRQRRGLPSDRAAPSRVGSLLPGRVGSGRVAAARPSRIGSGRGTDLTSLTGMSFWEQAIAPDGGA